MEEITERTVSFRFKNYAQSSVNDKDSKKNEVRAAAASMGKVLVDKCEQGRSLRTAISRLEEAVSWALLSIDRN